MIKAPDLSPFVGLPFEDKGRKPSGCDCWGLIFLVYRDVLGIELPSYSEAYASLADREAIADAIAGRIQGWLEIPETKILPLDGILMMEAGLPRHIGIVASRGMMLHMAPGRESVIEPYDTGKVRRRIAGFYRHEARRV